MVGEISLLLSLGGTGYAAFLSLMRVSDARPWSQRADLFAGLVGIASLSITMIILAVALVTRDFRFEYVSQYASRQLHWKYCLSALWVGQAGSLLLWAWMMGAIAIFLRLMPAPDVNIRNTAVGLVTGNVCFLIAVMVFAADPMAANKLASDVGAGLSPLLQHPSMLIHPPIIFLAYAAWSVPCALAFAALWVGRTDATWLQMARPWALTAWMLLGAGLLIGAHWAYQELGWGGYWGWDPVENGSLLPWLTGTAFVHGMLAWRHRECLKKVTISLAVATFALCNFATFLTRSGIFSSVHAFSESPIGWMFLALMMALATGGTILVTHRRAVLAGSPLHSGIFARETLIGASIFLLLLFTVVVMTGTLVAPLSKMFVGRTIQVGPEFYNNVFPPIALTILAMTAAVPLLQWGAPPRGMQRRLLAVCLAMSALAAVVAFAVGLRHPVMAGVVALAALAASTPIATWLLEARSRNQHHLFQRLLSTLRNGRRKYAAYSIHVGLACVAMGVAGSSLGTERHEVTLSEGDTIQWAGRQIRYVRLEQSQRADRLIAEALLEISHRDAAPVVLRPARHLHLLQNEWTTEVAIDSSWAGDFYTVLHEGLGDGRISMTLVNNPMIGWIWAGGLMSAASAVVAVWPARCRRRVSLTAGRQPFTDESIKNRVAA
jgi:cytochrome c-type biogenesis protein CcmF